MRRSKFSFRLRTLVFLAPLAAIAAGLGIRFYLESQIEPPDDEVVGDGSFLEEVQKRNRQYYHVRDVIEYDAPIREEHQHLPITDSRDPLPDYENNSPDEDPFGTTPPLEGERKSPDESSDDPLEGDDEPSRADPFGIESES
jgi:hypothetical protein